MNDETVRRLAAINRGFYDTRARAFSATRSRPWAGWEPLAALLREGGGEGPLRVLDVGCGNGRFTRWLAQTLPGAALRIDGVDASTALLEEARRDAPPGVALRLHALDAAERPGALPGGPFDLVALFGVIHGVPARERRRALLRACAERVATGGRLVLTTWRVAEDPRLAGRQVPWERYNARADAPVDVRELEPGDALLPWGDGEAVVRYFHEFSEGELDEIARALPLRLETRYRADGPRGDGNVYLVFRAS